MGAIYVIQNLASGKSYVGQTSKPSWKNRYLEGFRNFPHVHKGQTKLYNAIKKHGVRSFLFSDLMKDVPDCELDKWERYWISCLGSDRQSEGYNLTSGGMSGKVPSSEARRAMSEAGKIACKKHGHHKVGLEKMIARAKERSKLGIPGHKWTPKDRSKWYSANRWWFKTYIWTHREYGTHTCSAPELRRKLPELKLDQGNLTRVARRDRYRHSYKGWECLGEENNRHERN